jgi:hypothetical protein
LIPLINSLRSNIAPTLIITNTGNAFEWLFGRKLDENMY